MSDSTDPEYEKVLEAELIERIVREIAQEHPELVQAPMEDVMQAVYERLAQSVQMWQQDGLAGISYLLKQKQEREAPPPKRTRGPARSSNPIVAKGSDVGHIRADIFQQNIMSVLRSRDGYEFLADMGIAEAKKKMGKKQNGQLISTIHPLENEGDDSVFKAIDALGDGCLDTYTAVQMLAFEKNGTENITMPFLVSPDDILELCDKQKSNGGYTVESRLEKVSQLKAISQLSIIATAPGYHKSTFFRAEGRILLLAGKTGEYKVSTGETVWELYSVALGPFITMVPELNQQTAVVLRRLLSYSGKNERYQKRLGYYLTFMFRNNAHRGCGFTISMEMLLAGADIKTPREVGKFREAIERALADLYRDGVIGKYACVVNAGPEIEQHATGWWGKYSRMQWRFDAPEIVKAQYRKLLKEGNLP